MDAAAFRSENAIDAATRSTMVVLMMTVRANSEFIAFLPRVPFRSVRRADRGLRRTALMTTHPAALPRLVPPNRQKTSAADGATRSAWLCRASSSGERHIGRRPARDGCVLFLPESAAWLARRSNWADPESARVSPRLSPFHGCTGHP